MVAFETPYGLFNLIMGGGMIQSGNFNAIDWEFWQLFLKIELDIQRWSSNFYHMGTTQFISIPYALYIQKCRLYKLEVATDQVYPLYRRRFGG